MPEITYGCKVVSFSISSSDLETKKQVENLQKHCKTNGLNFSHIVLQGIKHMNKQLGLDNDN